MDLSHSLLVLSTGLKAHHYKDDYRHIEDDDRAIFSRSRLAMERFDEELKRQSIKKVIPQSA
jgi:hypothetical protein